ncbi:MAG: methyltransferase domain-containing protein [Verrucomicrobiaceae bacterium]|nr:methyltransferase domain-containing protein [Verrucomicrobiaceae bacterium]
MPELPPLDELLACPVDGTPLMREGDAWVSAAGRRYPTVQGIPVLFRPDATDTLSAMAQSRALAAGVDATDPWCVDTLGLNEEQKAPLLEALRRGGNAVDPVVAQMIAATCGNLYLGLVGRLPRYPVPNFRLKNGAGRVLVDLGCNWGRWCLAAAQEGFSVIGVDPQIGAVLAARRVARQLGIQAHFICADARHLPLRAGSADVIFSYSVIQHLSRDDVAKVIETANRVMKPGARLFVQMPNVMGPRCFYQWARRGFNDGTGFNVRYWTLGQLREAFGRIGSTGFEIDCFFGIGLQPSDADLMPLRWRVLLSVSETLRKLEGIVPGLPWLADSVYVDVMKKA